MANPIEVVYHRFALAIHAGEYTLEEGVREAIRDIDDLFNGKPHFYDFGKVYEEVQKKVKAEQQRQMALRQPPPPPPRF